MIQRVMNAYLVECIKAMRSKSAYVGPVLVVVMALFAPLIQPIADESASAYNFIAFATPMVLNLLGLLLILTYCAGLVSSETSSGTIRMILVRPLHRHEFLLAKLIHGMSYALLLTVLVAAATWSIAAIKGQLAGIEYGGEMIYTSTHMASSYALGAVAVLAPQFAAVAYAVMLSTLVRSTGAAVGAAIGIWIVLDAIKYPLHIDPFLFSTYMESPWQVFTMNSEGLDASWTPSIYYCLATSLTSIAVFTAISIISLRRRNIQA